MADVVHSVHLCGASDAPREAAIAQVATRQHGVIARSQLAALGLGRGAIARRVETQRLHRIHRGIYALGHSHLDELGRVFAAVLACGDGAFASHRTAARLWGFWRGAPSGGSEVTIAERRLAGERGVIVHRARSMHPDDHALRYRIPVTSVARTLLDLAEVVSAQQVRRAAEDAERLRLFDLVALRSCWERNRGRHGLGNLAALLSEFDRSPPDSRSELERTFVELCRSAGLPAPATNVSVAGLEVDALWPQERLVVELDGYAFHRSRSAFERDRLRDVQLQLAGHRVIRVTFRRLVDDPKGVVHVVRSLLAQGTAPLRRIDTVRPR